MFVFIFIFIHIIYIFIYYFMYFCLKQMKVGRLLLNSEIILDSNATVYFILYYKPRLSSSCCKLMQTLDSCVHILSSTSRHNEVVLKYWRTLLKANKNTPHDLFLQHDSHMRSEYCRPVAVLHDIVQLWVSLGPVLLCVPWARHDWQKQVCLQVHFHSACEHLGFRWSSQFMRSFPRLDKYARRFDRWQIRRKQLV